MAEGHFHFYSAPVSRAKGHSAVAAAAYQANQDLTHEGQRCFAVDLAHRNALGRGKVTDALRAQFREARLFELGDAPALASGAVSTELREAFALHGEELSNRCQLYEHAEGFTLYDNSDRTRYQLHITDGRLTVSRMHGVALSSRATAEKIDRREWLIRDDDNTYRVREYRENIKDEATGKRRQVARHLDVYADRLHRYARKGDVVETWVQASRLAPDWITAMTEAPNPSPAQRAALWNWAEAQEVARDGRPARAMQMALPRELSYAENQRIVREYVHEQFVRNKLVADIAIHQKEASDGGQNLHCHVLITTRELGRDGEPSASKSAYWNSKQRIVDWRAAWAAKVNQVLEENGSDTRIDHRSYADRGVDREPGEHMGAQLWEMEQRGIETGKGNRNREARHDNRLRELAAAYGEPDTHGDGTFHSQGDWYLTDSSAVEQDRRDDALANLSQRETRAFMSEAEIYHQQRLHHYLAGRVISSIHRTAETMHRLRLYSRSMLEGARSLSQLVFDRATLRSSQLETARNNKENNKGMDR